MTSPPTVLALRALKLGDLLVAVPALRGVARGFPEHRLLLACAPWLRPVAELIGGIDSLVPTPTGLDDPLDVPAGSIDVVVNLHSNGPDSRGRLEELGAPLRLGHAAPGWDGPEWCDDIHERRRWVRMVTAHGLPAEVSDYRLDPPALDVSVFGAGPGSAVVHVGAFHPSRHWPVERFAEVVRSLVARGLRVLLTGSAGERGRAERVASLLPAEHLRARAVRVVAGEMSLPEFLAVIAGADLVVSADTGAAHLASAFARPSVVLFGPAAPEHWGPPPGPHRVLTDARARRGDTFAQTPDPALLAVTVDAVLREVDDLLG
ncbi:ADP-heptose:LPS heptosyltransferase [Brevibacterium sanguinis]|uniref:ADP-heptose:LPS heptosyltransferase n=2 Tax=Brevibacterium TaxID=1696 RepID=A0A366IG69_9MICO|nr:MULTISPECIES: glycosyltransferase family 9 protein [Brevibacterium]RBP63677.1 ADP-heptose:LPS heptosyltransferase [Brevibacterium sanguinis]RBP70336.1 ADP-heptose:LPS heptosyltransferase [Brevibacterium celere]